MLVVLSFFVILSTFSLHLIPLFALVSAVSSIEIIFRCVVRHLLPHPVSSPFFFTFNFLHHLILSYALHHPCHYLGFPSGPPPCFGTRLEIFKACFPGYLFQCGRLKFFALTNVVHRKGGQAEEMLAAKTFPLSSPLTKASRSHDVNLTSASPMPINKWSSKWSTIPSVSFLSSCLKTSSEPIIAPETHSISAQNRVSILSEALPFIQKFRGKTIVVKYGGAAMKSEALQASVISDLVLLSCVGLRIVFVHGGGPEINQWLGRLGLKPNFVNGLRVTDATTMEIVSMVLVGKVNKHLVALINKAGATAVGLSGMDGHLLTARPSPKSAQLGFVGDIANVDPTVLRPLIDNYHIPVIASVAADKTGQSYNINADTVAGELAAALAAEKLLLLTDVAGILEDRDDPGSLVKEIDIKGVKRMMDDGKIAGGMIPKVNCCVRSLAQGVRTASIIDGRLQHSLLLEILTDEGAGTMITG